MKNAILLLLLGALTVSSCGKKSESGPSDSTKAASTADLTGAGSTFINPIMTNWIDAYKKETGISINYQPVGSGAGITNLIDHTVDFAGSDAPMNQGELDRAKGAVLHLPAVIGAVCVAYNIEGVQSGLQLSGPVLADIFSGKITNWDDVAIKKMNPSAKLPHDKIFTVHRSDGSGTTAIFTNYLSNVSPEWKKSIGDGKTVNWPNGLGGKGNAGVAGILKEHANSIGYTELAYAVQNQITYANIENKSGKFITPSVESASKAADGIQIPDNMCAFITDTPNPDGYPITGFSWLIIYKDSPKAANVKKFMQWVLSKGQEATKPLYYAPIPDAIRQNEMKLVNTTAAGNTAAK
jgi:phosphate transport system substrate-binding protein